MHQATHAEQSTLEAHGAALPGPAPLNAFVINLCSSTSPVALSPPDHAGLKRFAFFVSRRREESRERFRLHMGYFDTQEEAEKLLDIVREIYPGAWAGLAPGHRLRAAAAQGHAAETALIATEVAPAQLEPPLDAQPAAAAQSPTTLATPPAAQSIPAPDPAAATIAAPVVGDAAVSGSSAAAESAAAEAAAVAALALVPDQGRRLPQGNAGKPEHAAARSLNDVRAAIASLEDTSERAPVLRPIPELKPAAGGPIRPVAVRGSVAPQQTAAEISARGVLEVLERGARTAAAVGKSTSSDARSPAGAPQEVQPLPEKPCYAVQLMWSVQPMDIAQVPQLAIFSAYTLYGAEGNRDGRRWYGLRLGFFTDAVSAKQVAHYVRSEFSTVSVVPVTARERERAKVASGRSSASTVAKVGAPATAPAKSATPAVPAAPPKTEFQFIEDKEQAALPIAKPGSATPRPSKGAPGKRAKLRTQGAVGGRARTKPMTLEETLEILGAGELRMDDGRKPLIDESVEAHARAKPVKNKASRLGKLFERLSERIGSWDLPPNRRASSARARSAAAVSGAMKAPARGLK